MTTTLGFNRFYRSAIGAAVFFVLPVTAWAGEGNDDIVIRSASAMVQWQHKTTAELDRLLMLEPDNSTSENAIVQIAFNLGEDGKAQNLQFYNRDGSERNRMIAKRAIERLGNLAAVPVDRPTRAKFLANVIFADDHRNLVRLQRRLKKMETARLASGDARSRYVALGY